MEHIFLIFSHNIFAWIIFGLLILTATIFVLYYLFITIELIVDLCRSHFRFRQNSDRGV